MSTRNAREVTRPQRLLFGAGSLIANFLLAIVLFTIRDFRKDPDLQWSNGGESQAVVYMFIMGGLVALATLVLFVVPLVLLWPASSQRKHWYAMLGGAMLWPPLLLTMIFRYNPATLLAEVRHTPGFYGELEGFALWSCGCYLLLIRWQHRRLQARAAAGREASDTSA